MIKQTKISMPYITNAEAHELYTDEIIGHRGIYRTPIFKKETVLSYVPDYEKTNEMLIRRLCDFLTANKGKLGEITEISIKPSSTSHAYDIIIKSATCGSFTRVDVPLGFGKDECEAEPISTIYDNPEFLEVSDK